MLVDVVRAFFIASPDSDNFFVEYSENSGEETSLFWGAILKERREINHTIKPNNAHAACISPRTQHFLLPQQRVRESGESNISLIYQIFGAERSC